MAPSKPSSDWCRSPRGPEPRTASAKPFWRRYGVWLLLGLEFELAADIIGSVVSPTWQEVGKLGAIAVIRTFLNYFLEQDLDSAEASGESAGQRE